MGNGRDFISAIKFAFFPKHCAFCEEVIAPRAIACENCNAQISRVLPPVCSLCGRGMEECMCKKRQCFYKSLAAPFYYESAVRKCIWNFKFRGKTQNAKMLSAEMAETAGKAFAGEKFDLVTGVPLSKNGLKNRGYNQSFLLACQVGRILRVKTVEGLIIKLYDTPAQHTMSSSLRRGNLAGAFDVSDPEEIEDKTILLCDDVATTGSTLNECAKMLILSGAKEVYCLTAAVTRKSI